MTGVYTLDAQELHAAVTVNSAQVSVLEELSSLHGERLGNVLLSLFGDAKLEELTTILSRGSYAERQLFLRRLREIYPTRNDALEKLKD